MAFLDGLFPAGFFTGEFYPSYFRMEYVELLSRELILAKLYFPAPDVMQYILHFD